MNVEIVEFYENHRDDRRQSLRGTLHVYLCDLKVDLRGIRVIREKKFWRFELPGAKGIDKETNETVWYPVFSFMDRSKTAELMTLIRQKGIEYLEKNVFNTKI